MIDWRFYGDHKKLANFFDGFETNLRRNSMAEGKTVITSGMSTIDLPKGTFIFYFQKNQDEQGMGSGVGYFVSSFADKLRMGIRLFFLAFNPIPPDEDQTEIRISRHK